ncbi:MAG: hypothetical protein PHH44_03320 [bacterium]|nr:hypothetical protein [bacterium]
MDDVQGCVRKRGNVQHAYNDTERAVMMAIRIVMMMEGDYKKYDYEL